MIVASTKEEPTKHSPGGLRIAGTIEAVLADEAERVERGRAARELAASRYAWPLLARQLADCYERLL